MSRGPSHALIAGLFDELIDDAAIFPPGNAPLAAALRAHVDYVDTRYESAVGPLLVRASMVDELRELADPDSLILIGLIADTGVAGAIAARDALQDDPWLELAQVEIALAADAALGMAADKLLAELPFTVPTYIEVPQGVDPEPAIAAIAADGVERSKFRCGPELVPSSQELAQFIDSSVRHGVPFKLTAGLHHALPSADPRTGVRQHGFLNTLAATWMFLQGAPLPDVITVLDSREMSAVTSVLAGADVSRLRSVYRSFGSCSISEPVDELYHLDLLSEEDV
jgi:hypothetical protein